MPEKIKTDYIASLRLGGKASGKRKLGIKARYKGTNRLGYEHGLEYQLTLDSLPGEQLVIFRHGSKHLEGFCVYETRESFEQEWCEIIPF